MVTEADYQLAVKHESHRQPFLDGIFYYMGYANPNRRVTRIVYNKAAHADHLMFVMSPTIYRPDGYEIVVAHAFERSRSLKEFESYLFHEFAHVYEYAFHPRLSIWEYSSEFNMLDTAVEEIIDNESRDDILFKIFFDRREVRAFIREIDKAVNDGLPQDFIDGMIARVDAYRDEVERYEKKLRYEGVNDIEFYPRTNP